MKKNRTSLCRESFIPIRKYLRIMKLTFIFIFIGLISYASVTYSQSTKLTFETKNASIESVFKQIEALSEFKFAYNSTKLDVDKKISLKVENQSIETILQKILGSSNFRYQIVDRYIIITDENSEGLNSNGSSQSRKITGKVIDSTGASLPGVSVAIKGTTTGTITNADGEYVLQNVPADAVLQFSFVGMKTEEVKVGTSLSINVTLLEETVGIEEVVAVGYATQKRSTVTASISSVASKEMKDIPVTNTAVALQGKVPGVVVQQTSGKLGSTPAMKVRGFGSISAGNNPLIVVDGNIVGSSVFNTLSANEIESVDVLKDASSTAIYGSRGSNGVILITTKRGKTGKTTITLDAYAGFQQISKKMDILNSQEFAEFFKDAINTAYLERVPGAKATDKNSARGANAVADRYVYPQGELWSWLDLDDAAKVAQLPDYDYQDVIFRTAPVKNYQLSASGGNDKVRYMITGGYQDQDGIIKRSDLKKYTFRTNVDLNVTSKFRLGLDFNPSYILRNDVNSDGHWANNGVINSALSVMPFIPIYENDGITYTSQAKLGTVYGGTGITNPLANITENDDYSKVIGFLGNAYGEYDILKNLKYRISANVSANSTRRSTYRTSKMPLNQLLPPNQATGSAISFMDLSWLFNQTLSYNKTIGEHNFSVLLGMEATKYHYEYSSVTAINFANDNVRTLNYGTVNAGSSNETENSVASYFGRLNYDYKDRYLFNLSVRRDGSSLFGSNNRWGTFPAGSLGWRVSKESFMSNIQSISEAKLRVSYGLAGNNAFSNNYPYVALLSTNNYVFGNGLVNGLAASTLGNTDLGWEKSRQFDVGIDLGMFNSRIYFIADYYRRVTTDLLLSVNVPTITGFSTSVKNIGEMENKGCEFALTTKNLTGKFTWSTNLNLSFNRNKVLALGPTGDPILSSSGVGETNKTMIGEPIGSFFGYRQLGIFQSQADLNSYPHWADSKPGDVKYEDINGDKKIDANDRTIIGNNQPDFIYGMTNTFSYKGFDLNVVFTGVQGGEILNLSRRFYENLEGNSNQITTVLNRWRSAENPGDGKTPRANARTTGTNNAVSTRWVEDGSFLRLQNVTLGYQIPKQLLDKFKMQTARVYFSGQNLITWSKYLGYNPEVSGYENALTGGVDYGSYPLSRTFTIGINVAF